MSRILLPEDVSFACGALNFPSSEEPRKEKEGKSIYYDEKRKCLRLTREPVDKIAALKAFARMWKGPEFFVRTFTEALQEAPLSSSSKFFPPSEEESALSTLEWYRVRRALWWF